MKYYTAINTGKGFITHEDNELAHVAGYPANVWVTENETWASRVVAVEKTREEAQALIDAEFESYVSTQQAYIDGLEAGDEKDRLQLELDQATVVTLP